MNYERKAIEWLVRNEESLSNYFDGMYGSNCDEIRDLRDIIHTYKTFYKTFESVFGEAITKDLKNDSVCEALDGFEHFLKLNPDQGKRIPEVIDLLDHCAVERLDIYNQVSKLLEAYAKEIEDAKNVTF